jgi:hypothetical protein
MKKTAFYIFGLFALLGIAGCNPYDVDEILINRDDVSLTMKGEPLFLYDPDTCQLAYNTERNEYWAMADDMSKYFVLKAHQQMSHIEQEFSADLTYMNGTKEKKERNLTFKIEKISNDRGLVWLWCHSRNIGLVIRLF